MKRASATLFALAVTLAAPSARGDDGPSTGVFDSAPTVCSTGAFGNDCGSNGCACGGCGACLCGGESACGDFGPYWEFRAGALILQRDPPTSTPLITNGGGGTLIDASSLYQGWDPGFEVAARIPVVGRWSLGGRYFRIDSGDAVSAVSTPGSGIRFQNIASTGLGTVPNHEAAAVYGATLRSLEINLHQQPHDFWSWFVGFRSLDLNDRLKLHQSDVFMHEVRTQNNLLGGQIGADCRLVSIGRFELEAGAKAGVYANQANSEYRLRLTPFPGGNLDLGAERNRTSFVGEINLTGVYRLTDWCALRGGYQFLWIQDVAVAPDQFAVASPDPANNVLAIKSDSETFYQGVNMGLEFRW